MRLAAVVSMILMIAAPAAARQDGIEVTVTPATAAFDLGTMLDVGVTVTNHTDTPLVGFVVHLDITDPNTPGSVDPEDWTATLTKDLPAVAPGTTTTVPWTLQPIAGGGFSVYAVVMRGGDPAIHASGAALVDVAERRSLNPRGVLPVALGMPFVILVTLAGRRRQRAARSEA